MTEYERILKAKELLKKHNLNEEYKFVCGFINYLIENGTLDTSLSLNELVKYFKNFDFESKFKEWLYETGVIHEVD